MVCLNFIGGELVPARSALVLSHVDPQTGQENANLPDSDLMDLVSAIQAANKAAPNWLKSTAAERILILRNLAKLIEERVDLISKAQLDDIGTPIEIVKSSSVPRAAKVVRHHASTIESLPHLLPHGRVAVITPHVDPFFMMASRVSAALASGNVVILKPSEFAPFTAHVFAEILRDAGLPSGVFNLVQGRGPVIGQAIVQHPGLSTIAFVGKTDTGREIAKSSSESLKRLHLALGARNPVLVFAGVDIEITAKRVAEIALSEHPMTCLRGSRLFVQESIYKEFLAALKCYVEAQNSNVSLAHENLKRQFHQGFDQAVRENGKVLFGDSGLSPSPSSNVRPAAIFDLSLCSTLQQDDIEGPLVTIASFKYQHDAIKQANNSPYGQIAYVFEADPEKALRIAQKIEAGRVAIQPTSIEPIASDFETPFGGLKLSSLSRENGAELIKFFSHQVAISQYS